MGFHFGRCVTVGMEFSFKLFFPSIEGVGGNKQTKLPRRICGHWVPCIQFSFANRLAPVSFRILDCLHTTILHQPCGCTKFKSLPPVLHLTSSRSSSFSQIEYNPRMVIILRIFCWKKMGYLTIEKGAEESCVGLRSYSD